MFREMIEARLSLDITVATDGLEAYRLSRRLPFDLICTDFRMPRLSGASLVSALREPWQNKRTPVVVISGYAEEAERECRASQITDDIHYLAKPFSHEEAVEIIREILDREIGSGVSDAGLF